MAFAWEDSDAEISEDVLVVFPVSDACEIVCPHYQCKRPVWLAFLQRLQGEDGIMWFRHIQFDIVNKDFASICSGRCGSEVTVDCGYCRVVAVAGGKAGDGVLQRVLWRYDKIYHIKTGLLDHMSDDGEVTDM